MRILTITVILGLPLMALGQQAEPQQTQGQTNEPKTTAPAKGKKMKAPEQQPGKPQENLRRAQTCVDRRTLRVVLRR